MPADQAVEAVQGVDTRELHDLCCSCTCSHRTCRCFSSNGCIAITCLVFVAVILALTAFLVWEGCGSIYPSEVAHCAHRTFRNLAGIVLNILLLYLIRRFTRSSVGTYKYLLAIFASFDIFLITLHAIVRPKVLIVNTTFAVISNAIVEDRAITATYSAFFTTPFTLLCIHFLYRYWAVRHNHLIRLFSNGKFIVTLTSFVWLQFVIWFLRFRTIFTLPSLFRYLICIYGSNGGLCDVGTVFIRDQYEMKYGRIIMDGWLILDHWRDGRLEPQLLITIILVNIEMVATLSISIVLGSLTFYHIRRSDKMSAQTLALQLKLLIVVCAQTAVPVFFVYLPYSCALNFPFFRIPITFVGDLALLFTACFPAWDAAIVILVMKDYREGLKGLFKKKIEQKETKWRSTTIAVQAPTII